jgi:hypothetical protein
VVATNSATFTATVAPVTPYQTGEVPVVGTVNFAVTGVPTLSCSNVTVSATPPFTATCVLAFPTGAASPYTVTASFVPGNSNFTASTASTTEAVQDFSLSLNSTAPVLITQSYSNQTDPLNPVPITATASALNTAGFSDASNLSYSCSIVPTFQTSSPTGVTCSVPMSAIANFTVTATATATIGSYSLTITASDSSSSLRHAATPLTIQVGTNVATLFLSQGVSGTSTVAFSPATPSHTFTFTCPKIIFGGQSSTQITCTPPASGTLASAVQFTIRTLGSAALTPPTLQGTGTGKVFLAGLFGLPLLLLAGCFTSRSATRKLGRLLAGLLVLAALFQTVGCGGGFTPPAQNTGTAVGTYVVEAVATDQTTNVSYYATINVVVQ